jgi:ribosomal protein L7Ae-like RNA K-turn-binding protein
MKDKFLQFLGLTKRARKLIEGYNNFEIALQSRKIYLVILAQDLAENSKKKVIKYCIDKDIEYIEAYTSSILGEAIGRSEIKVICVLDEGMSKQLVSLYGLLENNRG